MILETRSHVYPGPGGPFEGFLAFPAGREKRAGVLVAPTVRGLSDFERARAIRLAELGYVALAIDIHGQGRVPTEMDVAFAQMAMLNDDRPLLAARITAAHDALCARGNVDPARTAAIGFCFGGKAVLDLARSGAPVAGVVAFHGLLDPPLPRAGKTPQIMAKVMVLHGWDDPLAKPDAVLAFTQEMSAAGVDWQLHAYGGTVHAFTNPSMPGHYREIADCRSWRAMQDFLEEIVGTGLPAQA